MKHIGKHILQYCNNNNIPAANIARNIGMTRAGFYKLLSRNDMTLSRLRQISQALNHNFFMDYYNTPPSVNQKQSPLILENRQLKEKLKNLETENSYLKEINQLLKPGKG
ncbi:MAG: hypothetical protein K8S18_21420 [Desulfobacula sp.]|nr:hypothetical protein [Desulfobacula sp.]